MIRETTVKTFQGGCVCGEIAFEVDGPADLFLDCDCSQCRMATAAAHSCEMVVKAAELRWVRGEASIVRYDLPDARSYVTSFCKTCGSAIPYLAGGERETIAPAGGFDERLDEPASPAAEGHIHCSRADCRVHGAGLSAED
jgi:hypothetical protein